MWKAAIKAKFDLNYSTRPAALTHVQKVTDWHSLRIIPEIAEKLSVEKVFGKIDQRVKVSVNVIA